MAIHLYSNVWIIFLELVMSGSGYQPITKFFKKLTPAEIARNESIKKGKEMIAAAERQFIVAVANR